MVYRLATVSFLNTLPLIEWFTATSDPRVTLERALPSRLTAMLLGGGADVALLPTVEIFRGGCGLVGASGIACRGAVDSVKLFYQGELGDLQRVAIDRGSRTSVALLRILLKETVGVTPEMTEIEPRPGLCPPPGEGVLVIGDRCFEFERWRRGDSAAEAVTALDLGQAWFAFTGLPFVFAAWAAAPDFPVRAGAAGVRELAQLLTAAREYGLEHLDELAAREAAAGRLGRGGEATVAALTHYFRESLRFRLGEDEMTAVRRFHELCVKHDLAPAAPAPFVL